MSWRQILNRLANPPMRWLLRSPLHSLVSRRIVLLEFAGRRSGRAYRTPVMYASTADGIVITTNRAYLWWRNLSGGVSIRLWLHGRQRHGIADTAQDAAAIDAALQVVYPGASPTILARMKTRALVAIHVRLSEA